MRTKPDCLQKRNDTDVMNAPINYPSGHLLSHMQLPAVAQQRAQAIERDCSGEASAEIELLKMQTIYAGSVVFYREESEGIFIVHAGPDSEEIRVRYDEWLAGKHPNEKVAIIPEYLREGGTVCREVLLD